MVSLMTYFNAKVGILFQLADAELLTTYPRCARYDVVVTLDKTKQYYDGVGTKPPQSLKIQGKCGAN